LLTASVPVMATHPEAKARRIKKTERPPVAIVAVSV
jgi:hypothetical protein